MEKKTLILLAVVGLFLVFGALVLGSRDRAEASGQEGETLVSRRTIADKGAGRASARFRGDGSAAKKTEQTVVREKPVVFDPMEAQGQQLSEMERAVLQELQRALDENDFGMVTLLLQRIQRGEFGRDFVLSPAMRQKFVHALGWFGSGAIPELVGFLNDSEPEIAQEAQTQLELALQDMDLADYDIAEIVISLSKVVQDPDALEGYFMELTRMRNSVMANTVVEISDSGTDVARDKIVEYLSFLFGSDEVLTVADVQKWLEQNPDGEDDDFFYGGQEKQPSYETVDVDVNSPEFRRMQEEMNRRAEEALRQSAAEQGWSPDDAKAPDQPNPEDAAKE